MDFKPGSIVKLETQDGIPFTVQITKVFQDENSNDKGVIGQNTNSGRPIAGGEILPVSWYLARTPKPRKWVEVTE